MAKILIVDEEEKIREVIREYAEFSGYEVDEACDGMDAVLKCRENKYDIIIMDIMMPNMGGETTLAKLKENPNFNIPVIALTADAVAGAKEKYLSEGFVDYIAKPFTKDQIKEKLDIMQMLYHILNINK